MCLGCRDKKNRHVSSMVLTFLDLSNLFPIITGLNVEKISRKLIIYIYIYIYVCMSVCVCKEFN